MDSSTKRLWHLVILASIAGSLGGEEKTDKGEKQEKEARKDGPKLRLEARGQDSRIDLAWSLDESPEPMGFVVERGERPDGPFVRLHGELHEPTVYSDFIGENGRTLYYRVSAVDGQGRARAASQVASAVTRAMTEGELLTSVEEATFRYFWNYAHPESGLARERKGSGDKVTTGGSGFGLMAILVGAERGFVTRTEAAARVLKILRFLRERAARYHGAWPHWLNGQTGETIPFSPDDDGGDLVETSYLVQGLLTIRQYFSGDSAVEREIRERATGMWESVEWDWYLGEPRGKKLYWHWSPSCGWKIAHKIGGHFNECMITYLLAIASPNHPIPPSSYYDGWVGEPEEGYTNGKSYFGQKIAVGWPYGGPLFFTHYSFLGFDPRGKQDKYCDYFENNRSISLIQQAYSAQNPGGHKGYSHVVWGLTASDDPDGYRVHEPREDNGTISPTASISAMPYVPEASLAALKHFYHAYGKRLWGEFGFKDAFNLDRDWFADSYIAINQGPIVVMVENYRTGLCWRLFMSNPEIPKMLEAIGWRATRNGPSTPPAPVTGH